MTKVASTHIPISIALGPTGTLEPGKPPALTASLQSGSRRKLPPEIESAFAHLARPHGDDEAVAGGALALRPPDADAVRVPDFLRELMNGHPPMPVALASGKVVS